LLNVAENTNVCIASLAFPSSTSSSNARSSASFEPFLGASSGSDVKEEGFA
jgi:hypothetical protein